MPGGWNYLDHPFLRWYYPELALCRTQFERMEASARGRREGPPFSIRLVIPILLYLGVSLPVTLIYFAARPYWIPLWTMGPVMIMLLFLFLAVMMMLVREHARRSIRKYLIDRGVAVCGECGYDLRGLDTAAERCPECGAALDEKARTLIAGSQPPAAQ